MIKIKNRSNEDNQGKQHHHSTDDFIDDEDTIEVKLSSYLIDKPCQTIPPKYCSDGYAGKSYYHLKRAMRLYESKLRKGCHDQKHNHRVRDGYGKCCEAVVQQRSL